jgi:cysteine desulfurase
MQNPWVYLDYNASTPMDVSVRQAMEPFQTEYYGNASSRHRAGREARAAIEQAREQVAAAVKAHPSQVIFTSGGTEANNLAIKGIIHGPAKSLALSGIEHDSILGPARALQKQGAQLIELAVNDQGVLDIDALDASLAAKPRLVTLMLANNETGAIQPVAEVASKVQLYGGWTHTDAVQALGKIEVDFRELGVQMMSLSSHKIYGPKGAGALIVDKELDLLPLLHGGGHEKGRRAGTENVAGIVGFGQAAELAQQRLVDDHRQQSQLRDELQAMLYQALPAIQVFATEVERIGNTLFFAVPGIDGESLLMNLDESGFGVSAGSACGHNHDEPSHVLAAMGIDPDKARASLRVSLGRDTTRSQLEAFVGCLKQQVDRLSSLACGW